MFVKKTGNKVKELRGHGSVQLEVVLKDLPLGSDVDDTRKEPSSHGYGASAFRKKAMYRLHKPEA